MEASKLDEPESSEDIAAAGAAARRVIENVARVIHAPPGVLERCVLTVLCEGHVIIEDFPGVGKTMLAKSLARSLDCEFARVQATPDLLPSDITGVNVYNLQSNAFEFKPGPVFANLVLVDEINRASPKTQSALLECMQEAQVTVDGHTHPLARPFMVIATQNPIEYEGTFPLPEAQLDRFTMLVTLGYPELSEEASMLAEHAASEPLDMLEPVTTATEIESAIRAVKRGVRRGEPQPLRGRRASPHPWRRAARPRCEPEGGDQPAAGGEGLRGDARARLRDPGRRQGGGGRRALAPGDPGARGAHRGTGHRRGRAGGGRPHSGPSLSGGGC